MIIIGITGTIGAGKGTVVDYMIREKDFLHFSVREFLLRIIRERNMEESRDSMVIVANELRHQHNPSFIIDELYKQAMLSGKNSVIESIRTPGEVTSLRNKSQFFLIAVDAEPKIRYKRVVKRNSETDHISFETFMENEAREMSSSDPHLQNLSKCINMADFRITNNKDIISLYKKTEELLQKIKYN